MPEVGETAPQSSAKEPRGKPQHLMWNSVSQAAGLLDTQQFWLQRATQDGYINIPSWRGERAHDLVSLS